MTDIDGSVIFSWVYDGNIEDNFDFMELRVNDFGKKTGFSITRKIKSIGS